MKPLLPLIFSVFSVTAYAGQYVSAPIWHSPVPMSEIVTIYELPQSYTASSSIVTTVPNAVYNVDDYYVDKPVVSSVPDSAQPFTVQPQTAVQPHTAAKPAEQSMTVPPPLGQPLSPLMPLPEYPLAEGETTETVRAQSPLGTELEEIFSTPPPIARGAVPDGTVDSKLTESADVSGFDPESFLTFPGQGSSVQAGGGTAGSTTTDPLGFGVLLTATVIAVLGFFYMAFLAYDYYQRWMQSLTMQNDRYIGSSAFDMDLEDAYGGSAGVGGSYGGSSGTGTFSESFGLPRRSSI